MSPLGKEGPPPRTNKTIVFTCTFYASKDDVRFGCCLETLRSARMPVVVVDGSPSEEIREAMRALGATVVKQEGRGKKGVALREALGHAMALAEDDDWLCWQEAEKSDMPNHWSSIAASTADCVVPTRDDALFKETYPIEQYFSENFANHYLNVAARTFAAAKEDLDWHFGPFAVRKRIAGRWLAHDGELWDAQVIPIVEALKAGLRVEAVAVPFRAPEAMKKEEENSFVFVEKRLNQINFLDPKVIEALKKK